MSLVIIRTVIYHTGSLSDLLLPWQTVTHGAFKNIVLFIQRDLLQLDRKEWLRYHTIWFKSQTPTALPDLWRAQYSTCTLWSTCIWAWYQWVLFLYLWYFTYWYQSGKKGSNVGKWTKRLLMRIQRHSGKLNTRGQGLNNQGTHQESHWGTRSKTKKRRTDFKIKQELNWDSPHCKTDERKKKEILLNADDTVSFNTEIWYL